MVLHGTSSNPPASAASGSTSATLLARAQAWQPEAWQRLADLYGPLVYRWSRQCGLQAEDAADVVQEVFRTLTARIGEFEEHRPGGFRAWLRTITHNKVGDWLRRLQRHPQAQGGTAAHEHLQELSAPVSASNTPPAVEENLLAHRAMALVRGEFEPRTWQAFWQTAAEGRPPADVAAELGMTLHAVYKAKSRVLCRLRQELEERGN